MTNLTCLAGFVILMCLTGFVSILVVLIVVVRRRPSEDSKPDSVDIVDKANSTPGLSGTEVIPDVKMPSDPQMALAQGRRAEGVDLLIHALREGAPEVSQEASRVLEELGEIEVF